ncbi:hypothetical protein RRF57_012228 [Xylaria bambusicola]|uniref:Orc1-like AAA ATPase domain-containing protein n=1 Tax=Xylaria bambusicola TaxID=326684 RepID=A0AAN7ZDI4_9PEZI
MASIFELPDDLLASLITSFPCREAQINALATLIHPRIAPCRSLVVHGTEATGKSAVVSDLLQRLHDASPSDLNYAIVKSAECVTARHFFERTVGLVGDALRNESAPARCETLATLTAELTKTLKYVEQDSRSRFVLVFDGIDRQRDAPPTLLPALARLSEIVRPTHNCSQHITRAEIQSRPADQVIRETDTKSNHHIHNNNAVAVSNANILPATRPLPAQSSHARRPRLSQTQHNKKQQTYGHASQPPSTILLIRPAARTLPRLRQCCTTLWPRFTAPVAAGTHKAREFSKLLIAARAYFQDESILEPGIQRARRDTSSKNSGSGTDLSRLLPPTARHLLIAAYLASHNAPRHDSTLFSTWHAGGRKRRRGGGVMGSSTPNGTGRGRRAKHRRIARKLLGPGVFVLERMVAIYVATRQEWVTGGDDGKGSAGGVDGDVGMAIATLASLRLLVRVGGGAAGAAVGAGGGADLDRGGKWRVNVGWEIIRSVGRSMGVEVEEWLVE